MKYNNLPDSTNIEDRRKNYTPVYDRAKAAELGVSDELYQKLVKDKVYRQEKEYLRRYGRQSVHPGTAYNVDVTADFKPDDSLEEEVDNKLLNDNYGSIIYDLVTKFNPPEIIRTLEQKRLDLLKSNETGNSLLPKFQAQDPDKMFTGDLVEVAPGQFRPEGSWFLKKLNQNQLLNKFKKNVKPIDAGLASELKGLLMNKKIIPQ